MVKRFDSVFEFHHSTHSAIRYGCVHVARTKAAAPRNCVVGVGIRERLLHGSYCVGTFFPPDRMQRRVGFGYCELSWVSSDGLSKNTQFGKLRTFVGPHFVACVVSIVVWAMPLVRNCFLGGTSTGPTNKYLRSLSFWVDTFVGKKLRIIDFSSLVQIFLEFTGLFSKLMRTFFICSNRKSHIWSTVHLSHVRGTF